MTYEWMKGGFFFIQRFDLVNFGVRYEGVEYRAGTTTRAPSALGLMGTDGSRFTYTYELDGDVLWYWFGDKGSRWFSRGVFSADRKTLLGRWHMPTPENENGGYDYRLTRLD